MTAAVARRNLGLWTRYSGPYSIAGTVKVLTAAAERPITLLEEGSFFKVAATRSVGGNYSFEKVKAGRWLVLAIDDTDQYNAVVVDRVVTG